MHFKIELHIKTWCLEEFRIQAFYLDLPLIFNARPEKGPASPAHCQGKNNPVLFTSEMQLAKETAKGTEAKLSNHLPQVDSLPAVRMQGSWVTRVFVA